MPAAIALHLVSQLMRYRRVADTRTKSQRNCDGYRPDTLGGDYGSCSSRIGYSAFLISGAGV